jgi:hypothetical protein
LLRKNELRELGVQFVCLFHHSCCIVDNKGTQAVDSRLHVTPETRLPSQHTLQMRRHPLRGLGIIPNRFRHDRGVHALGRLQMALREADGKIGI